VTCARLRSSLLSPSSKSCRRASGPYCCYAMCSAGLPLKRQHCLAARPHRSTAPCSARARRLPNAIPMAGRWQRPCRTGRSKNCLSVISRPGNGDLDSFTSLLKEDATYTMPPLPQWYAGRKAIRTFFGWAWKLYAGFRLAPAGANRQPAFAAYSRTVANAPWSAHSIQVLSLEEDRIATLTLFAKPEGPRLFHQFGLPLILPDAAAAGSSKATSGS